MYSASYSAMFTDETEGEFFSSFIAASACMHPFIISPGLAGYMFVYAGKHEDT